MDECGKGVSNTFLHYELMKGYDRACCGSSVLCK